MSPNVCDYSHTHSAWPVYVSIGNHAAAGRDVPEGKNVVSFINIPRKRGSDTLEDYKYCFRYMYQALWASIFHICNQWSAGFLLELPGHTGSTPTLVIPMLGVPIADIMELRNFAGVSSVCGIRCNWTFRSANPSAASGEETKDIDSFIALFDGEPEVVTDPQGSPSDTEDEDGAAEERGVEDDPPCDPTAFGALIERPPVGIYIQYTAGIPFGYVF